MKKKLLLPVFLCLLHVLHAQVITTYTSSGNFTTPAGVTSVTIRVWGGGGGTGGRDCGSGCTNAAAGPVGYVAATYAVTAGTVIGVFPGGKGVNGTDNASGTGGGSGGTSTYSASYNGGTGGNAGSVGSSGGGGGGGAATVVTISSTIRIVAGGAGGGGGMANSANSGQPGSSSASANGTSTNGGNGTTPSGDGGGGGGGGGGNYGSTGGTVYAVGGESAGYGGYRGANSISGSSSTTSNTTTSWTSSGKVEIEYTPVAGTASPNQTVCTGTQPGTITLSGYAGTIQWQVSTDNSIWNNITSATNSTLTGAEMGTINATTYYRAYVSNSVYSNTVTASVAADVSAATPPGSGTTGDPYLVSSFAHLRWMSETTSSWNKVFVQTAAIDAIPTTYSCYNSGAGWSPVGNSTTAFTGTYNGGGYTISNLFLNRPAADYLGFFGNSSGNIQNLNFTNANIQTSSPPSFTYMGIIAGSNSGTINGCSVSGTVSGGNHYVGGIAGIVNGTATNCISTATVSGANYTGGIAGRISGTVSRVVGAGTVNCSNLAGGIAGTVWYGNLSNSYATATVNGSVRAGGAVGFILGATVTNVYSTGAVTGSTLSGGCFGDVSSGGTSTNCYWDTQTSGWATSSGAATGRITAQMKDWSTFYTAGWDLQCELTNGSSNIWGINASANNGYPFLSWQGYNTQCPEWTGTTNTTFGTTSNWLNNFAPSEGMDIVINSAATNDLIVSQNWQTGHITFNNAGRKIRLDGFTLTISGTVTGADANNYVQTNSTGKVRRSINNSSSFSFPVGNSTYNPVTITNNSGSADAFEVRVIDEVYANGSNGNTINLTRVRRTWNISKTNANSGSGINFQFNWQTGDANGPMATPTLYHYSTRWDRQTGSTVTGSNSLTYSGYTGSFSPFMVAESSSTLPVRWLSFKATPVQQQVQLKWSTAQEISTLDYIAEHSTDGIHWQPFATITAAGQSNSMLQYSTMHLLPVKGINYYRILQRDLTGSFSYSSIEMVKMDVNGSTLKLYPNPAVQGPLQVEMIVPGQLQLLNSTGQLLQVWLLQKGWQQIDVSRLPTGTYYLRAAEQSTFFIKQ